MLSELQSPWMLMYLFCRFFLECHPVYDQTQGSGVVFSLTLLNSQQSLQLEIPTKLQKLGFGRRNLLGTTFNTLGQHFWNKIWQILVVPRDSANFLEVNFKHQIWRFHHLELKQQGPKKTKKKKQRDKQTNKQTRKETAEKLHKLVSKKAEILEKIQV